MPDHSIDTGCESYQRMHALELSRRQTRRRFLATGAAGLATLLGMPVRELYASDADAAKTAKADHVILLWMAGGMSHIDTLDPKPGRPTAGEFNPIKTSASGIELSEILPHIADQMKHCSLVRSVAGVEGDHGRATYQLQTSYRMSPQFVHPAIGAVVAHELDPLSALPAFISVTGRAQSAGYLGQRCEAYYIGRPGEADPYLSLPKDISTGRFERRLEALRRFNQQYHNRDKHPSVPATEQAYDAAQQFMNSPALHALDLDKETAQTKSRYGESDFGMGCLLARRLVETGVRFVQVSMTGFDTHNNNFTAMPRLAGAFDPAIAALISDLAASGKLDRTLVVLLSEFGRTPRINKNAGRDHHPRVFSTLLAGGGIKPGHLYGASDQDGHAPAEHPVKPADIHTTICHQLGIDPAKKVHTSLGRPMRLVEEGHVVSGLIA